MTLSKLIIRLICLKLKVKPDEGFQFTNQKSNDVYWFHETKLLKNCKGKIVESDVPINWLLSPNCKTISSGKPSITQYISHY